MKKRFTLTYSITTEASCENGDSAFHGFVTRDGGMPRKYGYIPKNPATFTLREAMEIVRDHEFSEGVHTDSCPWSPLSPPRWINFNSKWHENGEGEALEVSIHPAKRDSISPASMCRLARLLGAYGERKALISR